ncbi:MAG TPA: hypothetical protein VGC37_04665 [Friedmanniella sp.]
MTFWAVVLVVATSVHAGFQLTVTALVYPALARVAPPDFARAHEVHSRAIVPLVALVYGAVVVAGVGAVATDPGSVLAWLAGVASAVALGVTAFRAAPLHRRLGRRGAEPALLCSLQRADRVRTLGAVLALVAAVAHALAL